MSLVKFLKNRVALLHPLRDWLHEQLRGKRNCDCIFGPMQFSPVLLGSANVATGTAETAECTIAIVSGSQRSPSG